MQRSRLQQQKQREHQMPGAAAVLLLLVRLARLAAAAAVLMVPLLLLAAAGRWRGRKAWLYQSSWGKYTRADRSNVHNHNVPEAAAERLQA
jgi:hypothetical protein